MLSQSSARPAVSAHRFLHLDALRRTPLATDPYPHVIENGSPDARYAILERRDGQWLAAMLSVPYDARPMAALARDRGRPDLEQALMTGYLPELQ